MLKTDYAKVSKVYDKNKGRTTFTKDDEIEKLSERNKSITVLDLGCGTGLELEEYFVINPHARITGIDLTEAMLNALWDKFPDKNISLIYTHLSHNIFAKYDKFFIIIVCQH